MHLYLPYARLMNELHTRFCFSSWWKKVLRGVWAPSRVSFICGRSVLLFDPFYATSCRLQWLGVAPAVLQLLLVDVFLKVSDREDRMFLLRSLYI